MNLSIWNKVKQPPKSALKEIQAGRLKGKSDISPQWRYEALTDLFGPCGGGWGYRIERMWTEEGAEVKSEAGLVKEVMAFAHVTLWWNDESGMKREVPGIGGSMLVAKEKSGPFNSDEAFKMAVTDAISVACKALGFGADVYYGRWDGSKYNVPAEPKPKPAPDPVSTAAANEVEKSVYDFLKATPDIAALVQSEDFRNLMNKLKSLDEDRYTRCRAEVKRQLDASKEVKA